MKNENHFTADKYQPVLMSIFLLALFATDATVYKLVQFGPFILSAASIIFPLTYLVSDVTAEVYGYQAAKRLIWIATIANIFLGAIIHMFIILPSPANWELNNAFQSVYSSIFFRTVMHGLLVPFSYFINIYFLSKWKIVLKGRYFWLRSLSSTIIADIVFSILMTFISWWGKSFSISMFELMAVTYMTKVIWSIFGAFLGAIAVGYLKTKEGLDYCDNKINCNPLVNV